MPNSRQTPWTLSVKGKNRRIENCALPDILSAQQVYFNQMLAGKYGKNFNTTSNESVRATSNDTSFSQPTSNNYSSHNDTSFSQPTSSTSSAKAANLQPFEPFKPPFVTNPQTKRLGMTGRSISTANSGHSSMNRQAATNTAKNNYTNSNSSTNCYNPANQIQSNFNGEQLNPDLMNILTDERAKNLDKDIVEKILNEIIDKKSALNWDNIGGLKKIKQELDEIVIMPMQRPDLFTDLLSPSKGLLLFGPPGTGKTLIGRCIASDINSTFFSISASSLTSKWVGEGEKLVRALFTVARIKQPSVIFIDEIDSLLTQRSDGEHDSSRRIKTEFLVQFDGVQTDKNENLLVIGATNRPQTLDEAARRRFTKRLFIPLPNLKARREIICLSLKNERYELNDKQLLKLSRMTKGYSGSDLSQLCKDAALNVLRRYGRAKINAIKDKRDLPPITIDDFLNAVNRVKPTVSKKDSFILEDWNNEYGALPYQTEADEEDIETDAEKNSADDSLMILD